MKEHGNHEELLQGIRKQFESVFSQSEQGMYIYLDDVHKFCNQKFADMLGYDSPDEWAAIEISFPEAFVDPDSQETLIMAFQLAMESYVASTNQIAWKKKNGQSADSTVILVPVAFDQHPMALHFVQEI